MPRRDRIESRKIVAVAFHFETTFHTGTSQRKVGPATRD